MRYSSQKKPQKNWKFDKYKPLKDYKKALFVED